MWPFKDEDKIPRLGVLSPVDIEIHDPVGDWTYFGKVEMFKKEVSKEKGSIFFYRLLTKYREDEKVITSTQDFVQNADQVPYTQTRKGKARLFQVFLLAFLGIYALTLWFMNVLISVGPSIQFYQSQIAGLEMDVADIAILFVAVAGSWAWAARFHHFVSNWEIQPLRINSLKSNTDFYILTNSSNIPVFEEVLRLAKIDKSEADIMINAVRNFAKEEIDRLQEANEYLVDQVQASHVAAFDAKQISLETALMTRTERVTERQDKTKMVFIVVIAVAISFIASYLIYTAGG